MGAILDILLLFMFDISASIAILEASNYMRTTQYSSDKDSFCTLHHSDTIIPISSQIKKNI